MQSKLGSSVAVLIILTALCEYIVFLVILILLSFLLFALPTVYSRLVEAFLIAYILYVTSTHLKLNKKNIWTRLGLSLDPQITCSKQ